MKTSSSKAVMCRQVILYCPELWDGGRPAVVLRSGVGPLIDAPDHVAQTDAQVIDVNVAVHGVDDEDALKAFRARSDGNTFCGVPLFDALADGARDVVAGFPPSVKPDGTGKQYHAWAEWPPR